MSEPAAGALFTPGERVRTRTVDPAGHTRLPRYARGCTGRIVEVTGSWPLADDVARRRFDPGVEPRVEPVYTVAFAARELWGVDGHEVTLDLWQSYLEPYGETQRSTETYTPMPTEGSMEASAETFAETGVEGGTGESRESGESAS